MIKLQVAIAKPRQRWQYKSMIFRNLRNARKSASKMSLDGKIMIKELKEVGTKFEVYENGGRTLCHPVTGLT